MVVESMLGSDSLLNRGVMYALQKKWIQTGDMAVGVHGRVEGMSGNTNIVKIIRVHGE